MITAVCIILWKLFGSFLVVGFGSVGHGSVVRRENAKVWPDHSAKAFSIAMFTVIAFIMLGAIWL